MKKVNRPDVRQLFVTGNPVWDQALCHFTANFPRLMAHIQAVGIGERTTLFAPPEPQREPFAILTLRQNPGTRWEAIEDIASTLVLLARYLRYHARTEEEVAGLPTLPASTDTWGDPKIH